MNPPQQVGTAVATSLVCTDFFDQIQFEHVGKVMICRNVKSTENISFSQAVASSYSACAVLTLSLVQESARDSQAKGRI